MTVPLPATLEEDVSSCLCESKARFVFFCPNLFPSLSSSLKERFPAVQQILLSVGLESIDFCIAQQLKCPAGTRVSSRIASMLGEQILNESQQRRVIDTVITLSPLESEVEKWVGAPRVLWLERTIAEPQLTMKPVERRVGCVSTLNHPPNYDGIERLLDALARRDAAIVFRLVGGPRSFGENLAKQHTFVNYLGPLSDAELRKEAATWSCFAHPLFVYAKGCSTKLAVGLGWSLPIVTTEYGARGYAWDEEVVPFARDPAEMACMVVKASRLRNFEDLTARTRAIAQLAPTPREAGSKIRNFVFDGQLAAR